MIYYDKKPTLPPKMKSRTHNNYHPNDLLEKNQKTLKVVFDNNGREFTASQKVRLGAAVRSAISVLNNAYDAAQNDFEDDLARVALWFGAPIADVCALVRHSVETLHAAMTDDTQFITFYGKPDIRINDMFSHSFGDYTASANQEEASNSLYAREQKKAAQKGLGHGHGAASFGFEAPPLSTAPPKIDFQVGTPASRYSAPPASRLFTHAAGGYPIYIQDDALQPGVSLRDLRQIIYHQLAFILLNIKDVNARVGIGPRNWIRDICLNNAARDPEVTLTDGGNIGCFISSFDNPISKAEREQALAYWKYIKPEEPKKPPETKQEALARQSASLFTPPTEIHSNPLVFRDNHFGEQPKKGYLSAAAKKANELDYAEIVMHSDHFAAPPPDPNKIANSVAPVKAINRKGFFNRFFSSRR